MIIGLGIDAITIQRIADVIARTPKFVQRVLTEQEMTLYETFGEKRQHEFVAGRWAVKEAFSKAIGMGIGEKFTFQDISTLPDEHGKPVVHIHREHLLAPGALVHVSISHTETTAFAQIIIERNAD
ncbi:MAG: holo-ACP synthase [Bacilli bacterium]